jgi:hypothetical protein
MHLVWAKVLSFFRPTIRVPTTIYVPLRPMPKIPLEVHQELFIMDMADSDSENDTASETTSEGDTDVASDCATE